jgi:hypothetical protein
MAKSYHPKKVPASKLYAWQFILAVQIVCLAVYFGSLFKQIVCLAVYLWQIVCLAVYFGSLFKQIVCLAVYLWQFI